MANNISDITVNITIEDVVNPAAFGGMCLYDLADSGKGIQIPYTEVYGIDEANAIINASGMTEILSTVVFGTLVGADITKAQLNGLGEVAFLGDTYTVESNNKTINGVNYGSRIKAITDDNGFTVSLGENKTVGIACIGSSASKTTTLMIKDGNGNVVFSKNIDSAAGEYVSFTCTGDSDTYTVYSTSAEGATMHVYGINLGQQSIHARAMKNAVQIAFMQENPPEKIGLLSCDLDDLPTYMGCDFRYLIPIGINEANFKKLAAYIETCGELKVLGYYVNTGAYSSMQSTFAQLKDYERTFVYVGVLTYEDDGDGNIDLNQIPTALIAKTSNKPVGSFTYKNQALKGVYADEGITKAKLTDYHNNNINAYVHKAGYDVTSEGKLLNGEYIDILDAKDWLITQIKYQLQQALIINDKVPYDNKGIALLENIVVNILQDAYNNGIIAEDDDGNASYTVNFAKRSETEASDREKRQYVEGKFSFDLAGAIHTVTINGTINI